MKSKSEVEIRTLAGLVKAPCFHKWTHDISGMTFEFALHTAAGHPKGFVAPLAISELSTGYDIKAALRHANNPLTTASVAAMNSADVKKLAQSALYRLIHKQVGPIKFLHAMLGAQMQLAKVDLSKYAVPEAGLRAPGTASFTATATPEQVEALDKLFGEEGAPNTIEVPETTVAQMMWSGDMTSPTEEEWYEGLEPENKLEYLQQKLPQVIEASKELTKRATKADYDRIDDMDSEIRDIEAKIKALTLDGLKLRLEALLHTKVPKREMDDVMANIAALEKQIHDLEVTPCSK